MIRFGIAQMVKMRFAALQCNAKGYSGALRRASVFPLVMYVMEKYIVTAQKVMKMFVNQEFSLK